MDGLQTDAAVLEDIRTSEEPPPTNPSNDPAAEFSAPAAPVLSPEELVAKAIAPVKREYLQPPPVTRTSATPALTTEESSEPKSTSLLKEKKSKRQLKRERLQEQKSALHLCPVVAKSGNLSTCSYGEKCRFSHDVEAFNSQKPADLDGDCPFLNVIEGPCPYGLACRFAGTHKDVDFNAAAAAVSARDVKFFDKSAEMNALKKDVQKLLWKNKMKFPKADANLKLLGLDGKLKRLMVDEESNQLEPNSSLSLEENGNQLQTSPKEGEDSKADNADVADELRPSKKAKPVTNGTSCLTEVDNCASNVENGLAENHDQNGLAFLADDTKCSEDTDKSLKLHPREKKIIDFRDKLYLAPLTTVGNLPFRRICKGLGADVTCGEMAMCTNLLQGQASEWALLRRHSSEDFFGVQVCGAYPDTVARTVELIERECSIDFIDINMGCPIDIVVNKGAGSALLTKPMRLKGVIEAASRTIDTPLTVKVRTAYFEGRNRIDSLIEDIGKCGASAITIHGRSRQQRYSKLADWEYIYQCAQKAPDALQVIGNGDVFSYLDWNKHKNDCPKLSACLFARGALIKPWIFTEVKEQRHWDISSGERLNILKDYARLGLEHWGSDSKGVETTRHFLLEWLSYTHRYIPVGLLEVIPQRLNWRPPSYYGRDELETLMASDSAADWIRISEMVLGKVPAGFTFSPKHKSNAYDRAENG